MMPARLRLMQMTSQAFPIGGYSHSFGLESAVECGAVDDEASVLRWIADLLAFSMATYEVPLLVRMSDAWRRREAGALRELNEEYLATREAAELRAATVQMGFSAHRLCEALPGLPGFLLDTLRGIPEPCLPCAWSGLADAWGIAVEDAVLGYLWSWAENQVLVAMKTVPVGQAAGQRILSAVGDLLAQTARRAMSAAPASNFAPGLALLSARHETQYSRLFRS